MSTARPPDDRRGKIFPFFPIWGPERRRGAFRKLRAHNLLSPLLLPPHASTYRAATGEKCGGRSVGGVLSPPDISRLRRGFLKEEDRFFFREFPRLSAARSQFVPRSPPSAIATLSPSSSSSSPIVRRKWGEEKVTNKALFEERRGEWGALIAAERVGRPSFRENPKRGGDDFLNWKQAVPRRERLIFSPISTSFSLRLTEYLWLRSPACPFVPRAGGGRRPIGR